MTPTGADGAAGDTLYAPITATGKAAVVAVRLSGPAACRVVAALGPPLPSPRRMALRRLVDPTTGKVIDDALVTCFPAPASFTGEDVAEIHLHGGVVPLRRLLGALSSLPGLRPASPGAFTRRALRNGRLDLTQAEAIADLVDAETEAQARQAQRQLDGALGRAVTTWRDQVMAMRASAEALLDFADEGDVGVVDDDDGRTAQALVMELRAAIADRSAERLRDGVRVALIGPPNAGKSSLLNALAGRDVAIVHTAPGTTRDPLEVALELDGLPMTAVDTAGLRESEDPVEAEGVRRAESAAATADLRLLLVDGARWPDIDRLPAARADDVLVLTKTDLEPPEPHRLVGRPLVGASVVDDHGLDALLAALRDAVGRKLVGSGGPQLTRERHREALARAAAALELFPAETEPVLRAELLRRAAAALGEITGDGGVEAVLDAVFARFCIGK
ncbi:MAG: tRNA uridine-5-carboxymethylaminomethyl(34) synthesis GTPase MnmE [Pseudomonadota bacterium]